MAEDTILVDYREVVDVRYTTPIVLCDACGNEVEEGIRYYSDRPDVDPLDFCDNCCESPSFEEDAASGTADWYGDTGTSRFHLKQILAGLVGGFLLAVLLF